MRKSFLIFLILLGLLIPARELNAQRALVLSNTLNVRSGPGKQYEVIDKLKKGDIYLVERIEGNWVQLAWPVEAWVYKGLVKIEKTSASFDQLQIDFQNWLLDKHLRIKSIEFSKSIFKIGSWINTFG
jgi:hypothetical protein